MGKKLCQGHQKFKTVVATLFADKKKFISDRTVAQNLRILHELYYIINYKLS